MIFPADTSVGHTEDYLILFYKKNIQKITIPKVLFNIDKTHTGQDQ